jgi:hypothetical protein
MRATEKHLSMDPTTETSYESLPNPGSNKATVECLLSKIRSENLKFKSIDALKAYNELLFAISRIEESNITTPLPMLKKILLSALERQKNLDPKLENTIASLISETKEENAIQKLNEADNSEQKIATEVKNIEIEKTNIENKSPTISKIQQLRSEYKRIFARAVVTGAAVLGTFAKVGKDAEKQVLPNQENTENQTQLAQREKLNTLLKLRQ